MTKRDFSAVLLQMVRIYQTPCRVKKSQSAERFFALTTLINPFERFILDFFVSLLSFCRRTKEP